MPDSGNTTFWGYFLTAIGTMSGAFMVTAKIKGAQDAKITGIDKGLTDHKKDVDAKFDAQGKRIDSRVHVNDFNNLKETVDTGFDNLKTIMELEFKHLKDSSKIIENNTNRRRGSDRGTEDEV